MAVTPGCRIDPLTHSLTLWCQSIRTTVCGCRSKHGDLVNIERIKNWSPAESIQFSIADYNVFRTNSKWWFPVWFTVLSTTECVQCMLQQPQPWQTSRNSSINTTRDQIASFRQMIAYNLGAEMIASFYRSVL